MRHSSRITQTSLWTSFSTFLESLKILTTSSTQWQRIPQVGSSYTEWLNKYWGSSHSLFRKAERMTHSLKPVWIRSTLIISEPLTVLCSYRCAFPETRLWLFWLPWKLENTVPIHNHLGSIKHSEVWPLRLNMEVSSPRLIEWPELCKQSCMTVQS